MVTAKAVSTCTRRVSLSNRRTEEREVPPIGDFLVNGHEASVDIRLLSERATSLIPDLLSVVDEGVCEGSSDCGK
jgi:hypothetical protein